METTDKKPDNKAVWFALKCKQRKDLVVFEYLKNNDLTLKPLIIFEKKLHTKAKKAVNKWPGVIFVQTHLVKNRLDEKVKNFVQAAPFFSHIKSHTKGYHAQPIFFSDHYIQKLIKESIEEKKDVAKFSSSEINFKINDFVAILTGPFRGYEGEVTAIDFNTGIITLSIEFFGRITPMKFNFSECKKIN